MMDSSKSASFRIAVFGLGAAAEQIHLPACASLPGVEVTSACEPDATRRTEVGRRFGVPRLYPDAPSLLAAERPDVVIIGTPPDTHRDLCLLALDHGAHVLCEKPFVGSVAEADEVIVAADHKGLLVRVNNQYRFMAMYRVTQERLAAGDFGPLYFVQGWQQMFHPPSTEKNWRAGLVQSVLYEFGTHALDLVCFFFGALPVSVSAHIPPARRDIKADVLAHVTLRFPEGGLATLTFNRISHAPMRYLEMRLDCEEASVRISYGGVARLGLEWSRELRRPAAHFSLVKGGEARVERGGRSRVIAREPRYAVAPATALNLQELLQAISRGDRSNERARFARDLLRIVFAAYESASTGETVWLGPRTTA
jgi:predicted dehydrogenase